MPTCERCEAAVDESSEGLCPDCGVAANLAFVADEARPFRDFIVSELTKLGYRTERPHRVLSWCQSFIEPSIALNWHIGETVMRFSSSSDPIENGVKSLFVIRYSACYVYPK